MSTAPVSPRATVLRLQPRLRVVAAASEVAATEQPAAPALKVAERSTAPPRPRDSLPAVRPPWPVRIAAKFAALAAATLPAVLTAGVRWPELLLPTTPTAGPWPPRPGGWRPLPLAIGTGDRLATLLPVDRPELRRELSAALRSWCRAPGYLAAVAAAGSLRHGLDGQPVAEVDPEHRAAAAAALALWCAKAAGAARSPDGASDHGGPRPAGQIGRAS